jgi:DNA polymerase III sliding clamp (beta) subunit (PCNA family)
VNVFIPDKKLFINSFLSPISKINDSCVIHVKDIGLQCTVCTADSSVILHTQYKLPLDVEEPLCLNIADIKKVAKAFECVNTDTFTFAIDRNNISYSGPEIKFKYHLLENGIITQPKINIDKIDNLDFPINFTVPYKTVIELLRGSTFTTESNKVYLHSKDGKIYGDLTDRARHNVDSMSIPLCEYTGPDLQDICLNFELIRIISSVRVKQLECKINPKLGVILFQVNDNIIKTRYIASSLIK